LRLFREYIWSIRSMYERRETELDYKEALGYSVGVLLSINFN